MCDQHIFDICHTVSKADLATRMRSKMYCFQLILVARSVRPIHVLCLRSTKQTRSGHQNEMENVLFSTQSGGLSDMCDQHLVDTFHKYGLSRADLATRMR